MRTLTLCLGLCLFALGCDDDSSAPPRDMAMPKPDMAYASSCGFPGDQPINSTGVGLFCDSLDKCSGNGMATLCSILGDPDTHFCTFQCDATAANTQGPCGTGATCICGGLGCGCTPNKCLVGLDK